MSETIVESPILRPERLSKAFESLSVSKGVYARIAELRSTSKLRWPEWCYAPLGLSMYALQLGGMTEFDSSLYAAMASAFSAWRAGGKHIYRFDPYVFEHLWEMPMDEPLPVEMFERLPCWCAYIPTPNKHWIYDKFYGFFVCLEYDLNTSTSELRFVMDIESGPLPIMVDLRLGEGIQDSVGRMLEQAAEYKMKSSEQEIIGGLRKWLGSMTALSLYLCSVNAEIVDSKSKKPAPDQPTYPKRRERLFAPPSPHVWDVAYVIGAKLHKVEEQAAREYAARPGARGERGPVRPHMRRAHWHRWRTGKRNDESTWKLVVKWLPPIPINVNENETVDDATITTVHDVE